MAAMVDTARLDEAQVQLGRKLAFFAWLQIWDQEKEYGDFKALQRSALVIL
jgi:hypothetical protein